ncbi:MAG: hydroxymethylbilane synthase [Candidatus Methanomethylophilaceae archaeon]
MRICTRDSELAMRQTEMFMELLAAKHPDAKMDVMPMKSSGDLDLSSPLDKLQGFGAFVKELDAALLSGKADVSVNSMKDMPVDVPEGLCVAAILPRGPICDVSIPCALSDIPEGAVVGTSSIRRSAEIKEHRPDIVLKNLRGNVRTRLSKLESGMYDAIILAHAGVYRLGIDMEMHMLPPDEFIPAPAQGAIAVVCRSDDKDMIELLSSVDDPDTRHETNAERRLMKLLGAGCSSPVGINARVTGDVMHINAVTYFDGICRKSVRDIPIEDNEKELSEMAEELVGSE